MLRMMNALLVMDQRLMDAATLFLRNSAVAVENGPSEAAADNAGTTTSYSFNIRQYIRLDPQGPADIPGSTGSTGAIFSTNSSSGATDLDTHAGAVVGSDDSKDVQNGKSRHEASDEDQQALQLPTLLLNRILAIYTYLVASNGMIVYDVLRPRLADGSICTEVEEYTKAMVDREVEEKKQKEEEDKAKDNNVKEEDAKDVSHLKEGGDVLPPLSPPSIDTSPLIESMVALLCQDNFRTDNDVLHSLTKLLCTMTKPLDNLPNDDGTVTKIENNTKPSKKTLLMPVPIANVSNASLIGLCSILRNDSLSEMILDNVEIAITNLSKVPTNRGTLTNILKEVIQDLSLLSQEKLLDFCHALEEIHPEKHSQADGKSSSLKASDGVPKLKLPTSQLQLLNAACRLHERFHRSLLTLNSMCIALSQRTCDVLNTSQLDSCWAVLDRVTSHLRVRC